MASRHCVPRQAAICPACKKQTAVTLESRSNKDSSRRRRKVCTECNHRYTTYEVSEEFYRAAVLNQKAVDNFIKCLNLDRSSAVHDDSDVYACDDCVHMRSYGCSFEFPDAGGAFANECSMFELDKG